MSATGVQSGESQPRGTSSDLEELNRLKEEFHAELKPFLEDIEDYSKELETCREKHAALQDKLEKTTEKPEEEKYLEYLTKRMRNLNRLIDDSECSVAFVKHKRLPSIQELERRVKAAVPNCDKISNRLRAVAEKIQASSRAPCFASICDNEILLEECGYEELPRSFEPNKSPIDDATFHVYYNTIKRFLRVMRIHKSSEPEAKSKFMLVPIFSCALEGLEGFHLDLAVEINDKDSGLAGEADIVISSKEVEIVIIEDGRVESAIPQALVAMDCLSKKRLLKHRGLDDKLVSFGVVTNCFSWYFLKLDVSGTYSISDSYDLPCNLIGSEPYPSDRSQLLELCSQIRGLVEEAVK